MAQSNSEQYRHERVGSSTSAGNGRGLEGGTEDSDLSRLGGFREPPTSQVGYGGGDDRYHGKSLQKEGYWEEKQLGSNNDEDSRFGQDQGGGGSDSGTTDVQQGASSGYGSVGPNSKPSGAGFGSSGGPGGFPEEESHSVGSYGDVSSISSGTYGRGDVEGSSAGYGSEVRNGVPHQATSDGFASGTGISSGVESPTPEDIEQHRYHQTEAAPPSPGKSSAYSQEFTHPDGSAEGSRDRFYEEEGVSGNTLGGTAAEHHNEAGKENEKFLSRLIQKFPGNHNKQEGTDSNSGTKGVNSDDVPQDGEADKPGVVKAFKHKVLPSHRDEIDPKIFE